MLSRRKWIKQAGLLLPVMSLNNLAFGMKSFFGKSDINILIVSGWQDINIGDIAHTPGLINIFETFLPQARIVLWKKSFGQEVEALLKSNFPRVKIIYGNVDSMGNVDSDEVKSAFLASDIMIHGSGPSVVGKDNLEAWYRATGKPFGIFGTTIQTIDTNLAELLKKALFIFTRETESLIILDRAGINAPYQFFVPDATFYLNLRNDHRAINFLNSNSLEDKKFICVIPRLRKTPYYLIRPERYSKEQIKEIDELNNSKKEPDHAKLREVIVTWVRETHNKVLVCPEMTYEVDIMDELLIDPLPDDVKPLVIKRGYWFPDEAASVYARAFAIISFECHSPIISLRNLTPAFYLRQPEDTIKGQMYHDLGLSDWLFEIEETKGYQISERLMGIFQNTGIAHDKINKVMTEVDHYYSRGVEILKLKI